MKTAMQEAIEIINQAREGEIDNDLRSIRHRLEKLLEKEKEQIISACDVGYRNGHSRFDLHKQFSDDYYSKTPNH